MVRVKSQKHFYLDGLFDTLNEGISQLDRDKIKSLRQVSADARELMMDILDGLVIEPEQVVVRELSPAFEAAVLNVGVPQSVAIDSVVIEDVVTEQVMGVPSAPVTITKRKRTNKAVDNG